MIRDPRTIPPGGKSTFTLVVEDSGKKLSDIEITFEVDPKGAGSMDPEKIKTDAAGSAKATFTASQSVSKDLDALVRAKWKMAGQDKECAMIVEVRPSLAKTK
jgi:hypothetical protein